MKKILFLIYCGAISLGFSYDSALSKNLGGEEYGRDRDTSLKYLPLVEIPEKQPSSNNFLAVILSGDGGWRKIDRKIADTLSANGVPVVGLNTLQYFWKKRTPEESSQDLGRII